MTRLLIESALFFCLAGISFGMWWSTRHLRGNHGVDPAPDLAILHQIDRLILSDASLEHLSQRIVDLISSGTPLQGALIRSVHPKTGELIVLAVSDSLRATDATGGADLSVLRGGTVSPAQMLQSRSLVGHAINERRMVAGDSLAEFERPLLEATEAARLQKALGIKAVVVYPIIVEDRLNGAISFFFDRPTAVIKPRDHALMQALADEVGIALVNIDLLSQLEDMNKRLEDANVHLQTMDATKDDFISITSHQLRSPLTAIKGYTSMLTDGDFGAMTPRQRPVIKQIAESTNEVINVLNDMLSVSRINAEKFEITRAPVMLEDIIKDVVVELKPLAQNKQIRVSVVLPKRPIGPVFLDPLRIRQVLINYVDNAIKYTPHGKVVVSVETTPTDIVVKVKDSGIGIPEDELKRMFTKFYRAANARQMVTAGTGLGLYVAKRVIEDHGGTLFVESVEGQGATFGFRLPFAAVAVPEATTTPATAS